MHETSDLEPVEIPITNVERPVPKPRRRKPIVQTDGLAKTWEAEEVVQLVVKDSDVMTEILKSLVNLNL